MDDSATPHFDNSINNNTRVSSSVNDKYPTKSSNEQDHTSHQFINTVSSASSNHIVNDPSSNNIRPVSHHAYTSKNHNNNSTRKLSGSNADSRSISASGNNWTQWNLFDGNLDATTTGVNTSNSKRNIIAAGKQFFTRDSSNNTRSNKRIHVVESNALGIFDTACNNFGRDSNFNTNNDSNIIKLPDSNRSNNCMSIDTKIYTDDIHCKDAKVAATKTGEHICSGSSIHIEDLQ